jgi:adenylate cyclase
MSATRLVKIRLPAILSILATTIITTLLLQSMGLFSRFELASFDHRVELFRADQPINENVIVILIDEASLQAMGGDYGRWPWPRAAYVDLIDFFALAGVQGLAFDLLFSEPQDIDIAGGNDQQLVAATRRAGNVVHAIQLLRVGAIDVNKDLPSDFERKFGLRAEAQGAAEFDDYLLPIAPLYRVARGAGFVAVEPDRDGVYRRIRLFARYRDGPILPSLASALALPLLDTGTPVKLGPDHADLGAFQVPLDGNGNYLINPYGRIQSISAADVIQSMRHIRTGNPGAASLDPAAFEGKLVILGASAIGLLDVKTTALSAAEPGVLLHAYTLSNLLDEDFLQIPAVSLRLLGLLLLCSISVISMFLVPIRLVAVPPLATGIIYVVSAYVAFSYNLLLPVFPVIFALAISLMTTAIFFGLRQKQSLSNTIGAGDSAVTAALPRSDTDPEYTSVRQQPIATLLISINDFDRQMASVMAQQTVDLLNRFYEQTARLVAEHHGFIDHCDGATVRATWAATAGQSNHHAAAVDCAAAICKQITPIVGPVDNEVNPPMQLTIAVHSGTAVLGYLGLPARARVHAVGETVGRVARINAAGKIYNCPIVLSEASVTGAGIADLCFPLDWIALDNNAQSELLYALAEPFHDRNRLSISASDLQRELSAGFSHYRNFEWHSAAEIYSHIGKCVLSNLFVERCLRHQSDERGLDSESSEGYLEE